MRALSAWSRVPPGSEFAAPAAASRPSADRPRPLRSAEELLERALGAAGRSAADVRRELELLYQFEGRGADVRRLILDSWSEVQDPATVLKKLYIFEITAYPVDAVTAHLDQADQEDDRIWLSRANLAIRTGKFQEAASWLDRCEQKRPGDRAVARSRMELSLAAGDAMAARRAISALPKDELDGTDVLRLRAWFAGRTGNAAEERKALEDLLEQDAGDVRALDRLAELAQAGGRSEEAIRLRGQKAAVIAAREAYRRLLDHPRPLEKIPELIRVCEAMGRGLEARGWALVRELAGRDGTQRRPPLVSDEHPGGPAASSLADLAEDLRNAQGHVSRAAPGEGRTTWPTFDGDAETIGLTFLHDSGRPAGRTIPPAFMCGGVGLLDYDGDGWLDVYAVQAGAFPPNRGPSPSGSGDRLFRNRGDGTFEDSTDRAGIAGLSRGYGHGVTVADYDNDGHPDLFVTRWRAYALYRNRGDGRFEDVTARTGLDGDRDWPTSAAFADLDNDGDLDLYVCHYLRYDEDDPRLCDRPGVQGGHDCNPRDFPSLPDHLYRNDGGRFVDVTEQAGIVDADGRGLGVVAAHLDDDDRIDLFVANDSTANFLFRNSGGFRFEEVGHAAGVAANSSGTYQAGMGVACGDLDGDGRVDLSVTNFYNESTSFFRNLGDGFFADRTGEINLALPSRHLLGFGIVFLDADNDGRRDILTANGHIHDGRPQYPYTMPAQLLLGGRDGRLIDGSGRAGAPFQSLHLGRGLTAGDLDNDGRLDALMVAQNEPLVLFRNRTEGGGHFLSVQLEGTRSHRDAVGARLTLRTRGHTLVAQRSAGGSFQSAGDRRLHFGLGEDSRVDQIEVRWPSGVVNVFDGIEADQAVLLREGARAAIPIGEGDGRHESEGS
ncbi:MAG: FG-GAP-like repeat-containing protein [Isosphaeraceae bacterium]